MRTEITKPDKPKFENDRKVPEYKLIHKGDIVFTGTNNQCYVKLQRSQSQSADWAIKYDGWEVEPTGNEIDDPRITVTVAKDADWTDSRILFEYRGKQYLITKAAIYGVGSSFTKGETIEVNSEYAYIP
jgi:hypothetical protein